QITVGNPRWLIRFTEPFGLRLANVSYGRTKFSSPIIAVCWPNALSEAAEDSAMIISIPRARLTRKNCLGWILCSSTGSVVYFQSTPGRGHA
ncbi:unnamed protein product, partial [Mycena citricolor]